jgi:hypothetical protein
MHRLRFQLHSLLDAEAEELDRTLEREAESEPNMEHPETSIARSSTMPARPNAGLNMSLAL